MKDLKQLKKVRLTLEEIEKFYNVKDYHSLAILIKKLIEEKIIAPIIISKTNGQNPALYKRYSLIKKEVDNSKYEDEIRNELFLGFDMSYYKSHIDMYKIDRKYVIGLSNYYRTNKQNSNISISINELSFEIWEEEKFLKDGRGKTIIKNVGLDIENFNFYTTPEPFVFYSFSKHNKQRVLIIENKDTWYSIRKLMLNGCNNILGTAIDTIIYASGKGRFKGLLEYNLMVEEYLKYPKEVLYWGDIDFEGIIIYEGLKTKFKDIFDMHIFNSAYNKMISKAVDRNLPIAKLGQSKDIKDLFLNELNVEDKKAILKILKSGLYVPQEIVTYKDLFDEGELTCKIV